MKIPSIKTPKFVSTAAEYVKTKASDSYKYMKTLTSDTTSFVKKNPKHTAAAFGAGAALIIVGNAIKNAVESARQRNFEKEMFKTVLQAQNDVQKEQLAHIVDRQGQLINGMKKRIKNDKECLAANHETIEAARHEIAKLKEAQG